MSVPTRQATLVHDFHRYLMNRDLTEGKVYSLSAESRECYSFSDDNGDRRITTSRAFNFIDKPVQKLDDGNSDQPQRIPFNLERALAGDPVVRRDGVKVSEVLRFRGGNIRKPVAALSENGGFFLYYEDGKLYPNVIDLRDLFMVPKTKTVWVHLYGSPHQIFAGQLVFDDEQSAGFAAASCVLRNDEYQPYLTTVSVEVPA